MVPRPGRRSRQESANTRAAILRAAEAVFARDGLAGARTAAIAQKAGVNKAMLYYYFKSKEALYEAVIEEHFSEFSRQSVALLTQPGPADDILLRYVGLHFDWMCLHHGSACLYHQVMTSGAPLARQLVKRHFITRSQAIGALIERGMKEGVFRKADVFQTAISLIALIVFYFTAAPTVQLLGFKNAYTPAGLAQRRRELLTFVRHSIFTHPIPSAT